MIHQKRCISRRKDNLFILISNKEFVVFLTLLFRIKLDGYHIG